MADDITPALTPEEWTGGTCERYTGEVIVQPGVEVWVAVAVAPSRVAFTEVFRYQDGDRTEGDSVHLLGADALTATIAACIHALPDGHPLKFTREDVRMLRDQEVEWREYEAFQSLAAKLAAYLPPPE